MLRNGDAYGLAVLQQDGSICSQRLPWRTLLTHPWLKLPFVRGFPILLETLTNGIHALNRSVELVERQPEETGRFGVILSVILALVLAIGLFVAVPHLLSLLMHFSGLGGDVEGVSFHVWDGVYKCAIFLLYIWGISFIPDIHRVFEFHGAEHKIIHAWETGQRVDSEYALGMNRLHPRCGTTFLLFVIALSIIIQAALVPWLINWWHPQNLAAKHIYALGIKILLVVPISAAAYELIRFSARLRQGPLCFLLQAPGLALQRLTTREPDRVQLEVAIAALAAAVGPEDADMVRPVRHFRLDSGFDL